MQRGLVGGVRSEHHAVRVEVQHGPGVQRDVVLGQGDWDSPTEQDLAGAAQPLSPRFHLLRRDGVGPIPLGAEQDRLQRAVAAAGRRERPVELDPDVANPVEHTHRVQVGDEVRGRPHRADGMRTGRTDTDLEQLEDTDGR
jgi:hypothetical protein